MAAFGRRALVRYGGLVPVVLAGSLTLPFLQRSPLWADEADSASAALRPLSALVRLLGHQDGPLAAYYFLLHGWLQLVGTSAWSIRLPSTVALLAAVALTTRLGGRLAGPRGGLIGGGLLATNPFVLSFGTDARPYAFAVLAAAATGLLLAGAPDRPGRRRRLAYTGCALVGVLAHLFFVLLLPAHLIGVRLARRPVRPWLLPVAAVVLLSSPLLLLSAGQTAEVGYLRTPGLLSLPGWFQAMAGGKAWLSVPAAVLLLMAWRSGRLRDQPGLALWLLVPGPLLLVVSMVHPLYLNRYVVESAPALSLLIALALVRSRRTRLATVVALSLLAGSAFTSARMQSAPFRYENLQAAANTVLDGAHPQDGMVLLPAGVRTAVGFYEARVDPGAPRPTDLLAAPGRTEDALGNFGGGVLPPDQATARVLGRRVVWLVIYANASSRRGATATAVLATLTRCYRPGTVHRFGIVLVQRDEATGACGQGAPRLASMSLAAGPVVGPGATGAGAVRVGVRTEVEQHEARVAIPPVGVPELVAHAERGAVAGFSIPDQEDIAAGAKIVPRTSTVAV